jgi:hypothetical protein
MGGYHNLAEYSPVYKCLIFGGGNESPDIYKMDASGNVTKMKNAPRQVRTLTTVLTVDPVSGEFLFLFDNRTIYAFNPSTNSYRSLNSNIPVWNPKATKGGVVFLIAAPISTYGVIMFVRGDASGTGNVYLYKHSNTEFDETPPSVPANVSGVSNTPYSVNISWNGSTDSESGVLLYKIFRDDILVGQATGPAYTDTGLVENTPYTYSITALNGSWVESQGSTPITVRTQQDVTPPLLLAAGSSGDSTRVVVVFSESMDKTSAENVANYSISPEVNIHSARLLSDLGSVVLTTDGHTANTTYTLTVNNVKDGSSRSNTIASNSSVQYQYYHKLIITLKEYLGEQTAPVVVPDGFIDGADEATDRTSTWSQVPTALSGLTYLLTARNDKSDLLEENAVIYRLSASAPCTVFALVDAALPVPSWIGPDGWEKTSLELLGNNNPYAVYRKFFNAGDIDLKRQKGIDSEGTGYVFKLPGATGSLPVQDNRPAAVGKKVLSAYPNPFNPSTKLVINFWPLAFGAPRLTIYSMSGKLVARLNVNRQMLKAGVVWNGQGFPSGLYTVRLKAGNNTYCKKIILSK